MLPTPSPSPTLPAATVEVDGAALPPGFSMWRFAEMYRPTVLTFDVQGRLWAASQDGSVWVYTDRDGDGRADASTRFVAGRRTPLGLHVAADGTVYLSETGRITRLRDTSGDLVADEIESFISDLPFGLHQNDNLKPGPDGWLYVSVGSTCDACQEEDPRSGTIMRFNPETGASEIFARGFRNPYDLVFEPRTGALFATDNGRDDLGMDAPGEELNHVVQGAHYGWPGCWDRLVGPECAGTEQAIAFFEPHSSANSLDFHDSDAFPAGYDDSLYVAVFGSWLKPEVETGIQRLRLAETGDGEWVVLEQEWFAQWPGAMPLGLIGGPDGALYVGDYINGGIYRISYGP